MICTLAQVKQSARIDGNEFDTEIPLLIAAAQSMIEHECGVDAGYFDAAPDAGAELCAISLCVNFIEEPNAPRDSTNSILRSPRLDKARSWL